MKTMETTEEMSSDGMEKRVERRNWRQIAPCARKKPVADLKKVLVNPQTGRESRKIPALVAGRKPSWKCQLKILD